MTEIKTCPHCNQPILPATGLGLSPTQWRIYEVLKRRPNITVNALRIAVWMGEDGGAEYSTVKGQMRRMNQKLRAHGLEARPSSRGGHEPTWRIYVMDPPVQQAAE